MKKQIIKNVIAELLIACLVLTYVIGCVTFVANYKAHTEIKYCKVVEIDNGVLVIETTDGNLWEYETKHDYFVGEIIRVRFDNQGTETLYDDEIINITR